MIDGIGWSHTRVAALACIDELEEARLLLLAVFINLEIAFVQSFDDGSVLADYDYVQLNQLGADSYDFLFGSFLRAALSKCGCER